MYVDFLDLIFVPIQRHEFNGHDVQKKCNAHMSEQKFTNISFKILKDAFELNNCGVETKLIVLSYSGNFAPRPSHPLQHCERWKWRIIHLCSLKCTKIWQKISNTVYENRNVFIATKYQNLKNVGLIEKINYHEVEERVTEAKSSWTRSLGYLLHLKTLILHKN